MPKSIYIHIPFCRNICHYCDFNKVFLQGQPVDEYIEALLIEMEHAACRYDWQEIETVYIGGGTPTALNLGQLEKILQALHKTFHIKKSLQEFTVEANPGDVTKEQLQLLSDYGVNRLSIGAQTFHDEMLKKLGRTHTADDIRRTVELIRSVGLNNISLDLMFGLPNETPEMFQTSLFKALTLPVKHISAYAFMLEERTVFYHEWSKGKLVLPEEGDVANMYERLCEELEKHGFVQYEISNFSKENFASLHNLTYWNNEEYFGFGAGAHAYVQGMRTANVKAVNKYIKLIREKKEAFVEKHFVTEKERMEEEMFLGLRKVNGVSRKKFLQKFQKDVFDVYGKQLKNLVERGYVEVDNESLRLKKSAFFVGNIVFEQFLLDK